MPESDRTAKLICRIAEAQIEEGFSKYSLGGWLYDVSEQHWFEPPGVSEIREQPCEIQRWWYEKPYWKHVPGKRDPILVMWEEIMARTEWIRSAVGWVISNLLFFERRISSNMFRQIIIVGAGFFVAQVTISVVVGALKGISVGYKFYKAHTDKDGKFVRCKVPRCACTSKKQSTQPTQRPERPSHSGFFSS